MQRIHLRTDREALRAIDGDDSLLRMHQAMPRAERPTPFVVFVPETNNDTELDDAPLADVVEIELYRTLREEAVAANERISTIGDAVLQATNEQYVGPITNLLQEDPRHE